jgi:glucose/arabinose dehydrogenase
MKRLIAPKQKMSSIAVALALAGMAAVPVAGWAQTKSNPNCLDETAFYNPGNGEDIVVPKGFKVEVFARDLNMPTDVAFVGNKDKFQVVVLESGTGLPSRCNDNRTPQTGGPFAPDNPFTPDVIVFDQNGRQISGRLGKPTPSGGGFQKDGPAIGLTFEREFQGGRLFATDSNQGVRGAQSGGGNNTSRVLEVRISNDRKSAQVITLIRGLPTGDHPTEQIVAKDGWLYWSQGSTTNSGVTGHDNGNGGNQQEIPCQEITLSENLWDSGDGDKSSGFSRHGQARPGARVRAFEGATQKGMCSGAILRARISNPQNTVEPVAWGFRNPYGLRFSPPDHPMKGQLLISEDGEDERGARPVNNAPDRLAVARQNPDGSPEFHGWPDRFGFLDSTQAIFNPKGGPADDLCPAFPVCDPRLFTPPQTPVGNILAFPPQPIVAPLALEPADVAAVGLDFAPNAFLGGVVKKNAVLLSREGDFGFSPGNGDPILGHDIELINFTKQGNPNELQMSRFAFNCPAPAQRHDPDGSSRCDVKSGQAFADMLRGINRPTTVRFGPDGAAYLVDYGAVRDFGRSDPKTRFTNPADAPLVQIPGTGTIASMAAVTATVTATMTTTIVID